MTVSALKQLYRSYVPGAVRTRVRQSRFLNNGRAMSLATGLKRLDLCAAQIATNLHLAQCPSLEGMVCLEIGAGWVLSHALIFHLLGAKRVIATDITRLAYPAACHRSVSTALQAAVRDVLAPFSEYGAVRARLDRLVNAAPFNIETLARLGVDYVAPIDLARKRLDTPVDFIYSGSVLEHVPVDDIPHLLYNLSQDLTCGGRMIHCIHLEDHRDPLRRPYAFLSEPETGFPRDVSLERGNRIRTSEWKRLFDEVEGWETRYLYQWSRKDVDLPEVVHPSVIHQGPEDLRVSHIGLLSLKR